MRHRQVGLAKLAYCLGCHVTVIKGPKLPSVAPLAMLFPHKCYTPHAGFAHQQGGFAPRPPGPPSHAGFAHKQCGLTW
eukprot:1156692-Pelagomonas_calceolata.AAC.1